MTRGSPGAAGPAILFVCLGNICRSPLAEGAARAALAEQGLRLALDSAGTGDWHVGRPPDTRAQAAARRAGFAIDDLRARQIARSDFARFSHILAADHSVLADLRALAPADSRARVMLMLDLVPGRAGQAIADPYYGDADGFDTTVADVMAVAARLAALNGPD